MHIHVGAVFEPQSDDGVIDIVEGEIGFNILFGNGFSYGAVPIRVTTFTYSEFAARGYNLEDEFDSDDIPMDAADGVHACSLLLCSCASQMLFNLYTCTYIECVVHHFLCV